MNSINKAVCFLCLFLLSLTQLHAQERDFSEIQITSEKIVRLRHGLELDGRLLRPAKVERIVASRLRFVLVEGRKRQIRRMCEQVDLTVTRLVRVRIGRIELGKLGRGQWRLLQPGESF